MNNHVIYVVDKSDPNTIDFLMYILNNLNTIKQMNVNVQVVVLEPSQENFEIHHIKVNIFPVLVTGDNVYESINTIYNLYQNNITQFMAFKSMQQAALSKAMQADKQRDYSGGQRDYSGGQRDDQRENTNQQSHQDHQSQQNHQKSHQSHHNQHHNQHQKQVNTFKKEDSSDDDMAFNGSDNSDMETGNGMMDTYRDMLLKRSGKDHSPGNHSKGIHSQNSSKKDKDNENNKDNQNRDSVERDDNIADEKPINFDPATIADDDIDPNDAKMEKAYWSRISESK